MKGKWQHWAWKGRQMSITLTTSLLRQLGLQNLGFYFIIYIIERCFLTLMIQSYEHLRKALAFFFFQLLPNPPNPLFAVLLKEETEQALS